MNCLVIRDIFLHRSLFSEAVQVLPAAPSAGLCVSAFIFVFNNSTALRTSGWLAYGRKPHFMPWETLALLVIHVHCEALCECEQSSAHCFGHISSNQQWAGSRQPYMPVSSRCLRHRKCNQRFAACCELHEAVSCSDNDTPLLSKCSWLGYILWCLCVKAIKY